MHFPLLCCPHHVDCKRENGRVVHRESSNAAEVVLKALHAAHCTTALTETQLVQECISRNFKWSTYS